MRGVYLILILLLRGSRAIEVQGDSWCSYLMCITALINNTVVTYEMTSLNQLGWMAIGFGSAMANSAMIIMWPNEDDSVTLSQRTATGLVEPLPDPSPPRVATAYPPLTSLAAVNSVLSFTISKTNATTEDMIWAFGVTNPNSSDPAVDLLMHLDSGNFTLNLTNKIDPDQVVENASQTVFIPSSTSGPDPLVAPTAGTQQGTPGGGSARPLRMFEKLIIVHAVFCTLGFIVLLPLGALAARWGRTVTPLWSFYHWTIQVLLCIPLIVVGWSLGFLAVAEQGRKHADDVHKIFGSVLFALYFFQLCFGTYIHFRIPLYPVKHPKRNLTHAFVGIVLIALSFYQVRTGLTIEWGLATKRTIDLDILLNLWIVWLAFFPLVYFSGFLLLRRQLAHEREQPPPYVPRSDSSESSEGGIAIRHLLGGPQALLVDDDGTHDIFSEFVSTRMRTSELDAIEMREVSSDHLIAVSHTLYRPNTR